MPPSRARRTAPSATTAGPRPDRSGARPSTEAQTRGPRSRRSRRECAAPSPGSLLCVESLRLASPLNLHDDGQHHRSPLGALVQEIHDAVVDRVFECGRLGEVLAGLRLSETIQDLLLGLLDDLRGIVLRYEALRHD